MSYQVYLRTFFSAAFLGGGLFFGATSAIAVDKRSSSKIITPAAYQSFRADVSEIAKLRLDKPRNVEKARRLLVNYNEVDLSRGAVAEFAAVAAESKRFSKGLKKAVRANGGKRKFLSNLKANPNYVLQVKGWETAARDVSAAALRDTAQIQALAYRFNEVAYGRTSKEASLARKGVGVTSSTKPRPVKSASPLMVHVLALGAMMQLEGVKSLTAKPALSPFTAYKKNDQCLRWARLNTSQCLAAAGTNEETAYCLSTQALDSRRKCWASLTSAGQ